MITSNQTPQHSSNHVQSQNPLWQNPLLKIGVAVVTLITILVVMNVTIGRYETHLHTGEVVLLELAPADPRGFMQGDYMRLRFAVSNEVREMIENTDTFSREKNTPPKSVDGFAIIQKDAHNVGHLVRIIDTDELDTQTLNSNEIPLYYRVRGRQIKFATNAFFFQEGHAKAYEQAEYGMFRVNDNGEPLLTHMVDADFNIIEAVEMNDNEENIAN